MPRDAVVEPWQSFLAAIDVLAARDVELHCIGGFAVSTYYGLNRPTGDIDVVEAKPAELKPWLIQTAGPGSRLFRTHRVYLQVVTVASMPEDYESRLTELVPGRFKRLRVLVPDPYDLALSKLTRNLEVDMDDVKHLARTCRLDLHELERRYRDELRAIVIGPVERHDQTLRLWLDAIREERGDGVV
jgi:hypothetical protein